jgi:vitamin B12 transporter
MVRRPWIVVALLLCVGSAAFPAFAQELAEPEIGEVVVTATRTADPVGAATKSFTVITAEEIEAKQAQTVREALRTVPGFSLSQTGGLGTQTSTFLRGSESDHTLFLIDGIPVNSPANGQFDLSDLTTDNVERIEIVRGPQSTLYGSAAMGGVVNIITRRGTGAPTHRVRFEAGKHSTFRETLSSAGGGDRWDYAVAGSRLDSQGELSHDGYENTTLSGRVGWKPTPATRLEVFSRFLEAEKDLPPVLGRQDGTTFAPFDPDQSQRRELTQAGVTFSHALTPAWDYKVTLARVVEETRFTDPPSAPSVTETDVDDVEFVTSFRPLPYVVLTAGGQWKQEGADTATLHPTVTDKAGYVQAQVTLLDRLTLLGSARVDDHSRFGTHGTGQVSGVYQLTATGTAIRAGYGTAFRAPSLNDLFLFPPFSNPNLQPERSRTWEAGVEQRLFGSLATLSATYFYTRFTDLIAGAPPTFISQNIGSARSNGVEAAVEIRPLEGLTLKGTYNFTQPIDRITRQPLLRRPKHLGSASAIYQFARRYSLAATALFVGERPDVDPVTFATVTNGGYAKVDLAAGAVLSEEWGPLRSLRLTAKIDNLLNERYDDVLGFPALGLTYVVGLEANF